eukprot:12709341-Alexandrium_andersonii.AAC.1
MPIQGNRGGSEEPPLEVCSTVPGLVLLEPEEFGTLLIQGVSKPVRSPRGRNGIARLEGGDD